MSLFRMDLAARHRQMLRLRRMRATSFVALPSASLPEASPEPPAPSSLLQLPPPSIPPQAPSGDPVYTLILAKKVKADEMAPKVSWWTGLKATDFQLQPNQPDGSSVVFRSAQLTDKMQGLLISGKLTRV